MNAQICDSLLLRDEIEFFEQHRREWLREREGQFALIGKQTFAGFHASYEAAMAAGLRAFGPVAPFQVRRITRE